MLFVEVYFSLSACFFTFASCIPIASKPKLFMLHTPDVLGAAGFSTCQSFYIHRTSHLGNYQSWGAIFSKSGGRKWGRVRRKVFQCPRACASTASLSLHGEVVRSAACTDASFLNCIHSNDLHTCTNTTK